LKVQAVVGEIEFMCQTTELLLQLFDTPLIRGFGRCRNRALLPNPTTPFRAYSRRQFDSWLL
jgi:hypothetical protein